MAKLNFVFSVVNAVFALSSVFGPLIGVSYSFFFGPGKY
jgi:hypothetical protein